MACCVDETCRCIRGRRIPLFVFLLLAFALPCTTPAQIPPPKPAPLSPQVPSGTGGCAIGKSCAELAPQMVQSALALSPLEDNLRYLTDTIGGRVTGSAAASRAALWAVEAFRRAGVDEVHIEKFTVPVGWSEGLTRIEILSADPFAVHAVSIGWSPATPEGGINADVVDVASGDDAGFASAGAPAKGAIVLVHSDFLVTWEDLDKEYKIAPGVIDRAIRAGAAAIFWMSSRPNLLLYRNTTAFDGHIERLPQAVVAREDAERMARFLAAGQKLRVRFEMPNRITGPIESENVVAEIRGYDKPAEFVLLGAHLDSWELGTGALDNGCNAALVIDATRVIHESGSIPRRSIRFVLFTGEEQGLLGSWAYARAHRDELDRMIAAAVFDSGIGRVTGYSLGGRKDVLAAANEVLAPLESLGARNFTLDADDGTDHFDFLLEGVPTLVANQEPANYMLNYHAASDTFDKVDIPALKKHVAIAAITTYALADARDRIGPRQSRAEVEQLLRATGLADGMKREGSWSLWESGARGRQQ
jgi:carboxypeptidase Q